MNAYDLSACASVYGVDKRGNATGILLTERADRMVIAILLSIAIILCGCAHEKTDKQISPIPLQTQNSSQQIPATLAQQKICADQAEKNFNDSSFSGKDEGGTYTNHFDPESGVCYMEVTIRRMSIDNNFQFSDIILDAFENRTYGELTTFSKDRKPVACSVKPRGQSEIICESKENFDALALKYFGVASE